MKREASHSNAQLKAEEEMIQSFGEQLGVTLQSRPLPIANGTSMRIDGYHEQNKKRTLVEAFARTKELKSGQKRKILADILKLIFLAESLLSEEPDLVIEKYILFQSDTAAQFFRGNSWAAKACEHFRVNIRVQKASDETFAEVEQAEIMQTWIH